LLDLDDLRMWAARGLEARAGETEHVRAIIGEEVERFVVDVTARQAAPLVAQLHERAEAVRRAELERFAGRLAALDPQQLAAVEALTKGILGKLLHQPSVRLKEDAGTPQGERNAAAVRDLFDLG
jgi:glutamyl-tRNA reductase